MPLSHPKHRASDWRALIVSTCARVWPSLVDGPLWIEAQVHTESAGNPNAASGVGARGLLQLMPGTARELGLTADQALDPAKNLDAGVRYLKIQFDHFPEIPNPLERLFWSFAAYNGGRGYCNKALSLARAAGVRDWHVWEVGKRWLAGDACKVAGRTPDESQMWNYVTRIQRVANRLSQEV